MTLRERRIERLWAALADERLDALVVAGKGLIGQYGALEWCAGYVPVVRGAYAVLTPGAEPALVVTTAADAWYARRNTGLARGARGGAGRHPLRVRRPGLGRRRARSGDRPDRRRGARAT